MQRIKIYNVFKEECVSFIVLIRNIYDLIACRTDFKLLKIIMLCKFYFNTFFFFFFLTVFVAPSLLPKWVMFIQMLSVWCWKFRKFIG